MHSNGPPIEIIIFVIVFVLLATFVRFSFLDQVNFFFLLHLQALQ